MAMQNQPKLQFKGLEARPGNLNAIFEKNMMLARNRIGANPLGYNGSEVVRSALPSFTENSLRNSLAPPEPPRKTEEEIAEEKRRLQELEEARLEAIRIAREAEERRKAEEAEKERIRLAEIARKEAEVKAAWDAAYNKVKIDFSVVNQSTTRWTQFANDMFEETRSALSQTTGYLPPRLTESFDGGVSPLVEKFKEAVTPRNKTQADEFPTEDVVAEDVVVKEEEAAAVVEAVAVVEEEKAAAVVEDEVVPTVEAEETAPASQYCQVEPVQTTEEVGVSPVSVTTQERTSPFLVKKEMKDLKDKESAPTTATQSLDVEAEEVVPVVAVEEKGESTEASSKDVVEEVKETAANNKKRGRSNNKNGKKKQK